jgi:hypothetical protein
VLLRCGRVRRRGSKQRFLGRNAVSRLLLSEGVYDVTVFHKQATVAILTTPGTGIENLKGGIKVPFRRIQLAE